MKFFFLITGSDLLFNKLDEIEIPIIGFHYLRNSIISDSDFKRYPVLSLKWLYMTSSDCLELTHPPGLPGEWRCFDDQLSWGYIVKQLSAYGGCLGSQRR